MGIFPTPLFCQNSLKDRQVVELPAAPPYGVGVPETVEGSTKICGLFFFSEGQDAQEIQNASRCTKIIGSAIAELLSNDH